MVIAIKKKSLLTEGCLHSVNVAIDSQGILGKYFIALCFKCDPGKSLHPNSLSVQASGYPTRKHD